MKHQSDSLVKSVFHPGRAGPERARMPPWRVCQSGKARQVQATTGYLWPGASPLPLNASRYGPTDWGNRCDAVMSGSGQNENRPFSAYVGSGLGGCGYLGRRVHAPVGCDGTGTSRNKTSKSRQPWPRMCAMATGRKRTAMGPSCINRVPAYSAPLQQIF
jgi:hypothetical protein